MRRRGGQHGPETTLARRWSATHLGARPWEPPALPTLLVVPHPDDEVLAFGLLIARQCGRRVRVTVLAVTDGEAAYPGEDPAGLAAHRRHEQHAALADLGVTEPVRRLGLPDGDVTSHEDALVGMITAHAGDHPLVAAPWIADHHPDHDACGRAAERAAIGAGATLVHGLFWAWHRGQPADLLGRRVLALGGRPDERAVRAAALRHHASQRASLSRPDPVLTEADLEPLSWACEYYVCRDGARS